MYKFIKNYKENDVYRLSFNALAQKTFGIDFEKWYQAGCWNDQYICYSFLEGDTVVANASVSHYKMWIEGQMRKVVQIGTVMTDENHRRKGLGRKLMDAILDDYQEESDLIFLFGDCDALDFYHQFDFSTTNETSCVLDVSEFSFKDGEIRQLSIENNDDFELIKAINKERVVLNRECDVIDAQHISNWHAINLFPEHLYYLPDEDSLVYMKHREDTLHVFGISSRKSVELDLLLSRMMTSDTKKVICHFTVTETKAKKTCRPVVSDDEFFVKGASFPEEFMYPYVFRA